MRRMMAISCVSVLLAGAASGCFISRKKEVVHEPRTSTTYEHRSTTETVPGDTETHTIERY